MAYNTLTGYLPYFSEINTLYLHVIAEIILFINNIFNTTMVIQILGIILQAIELSIEISRLQSSLSLRYDKMLRNIWSFEMMSLC